MVEVLLATCADFPDGDEDGPEILIALDAASVAARWCVWDDPSVDWSAGLVVLRATWDYTLRREEFLTWTSSVPRLLNPHPAVVWNSDKTYLRAAAAAGVPVTPTAWAAPGEDAVFPERGDFVVKPSVGAGSRGAGRFASGSVDEARAHVATLHGAGRTAMVQPYLDQVDGEGETALIYLDGEFSHAVRKSAMLAPGMTHGVLDDSLYVEEAITARTPSETELAAGAKAMGFLHEHLGELLYARIDLLPGADGPVVVELEVTEPSLFLSFADGAADRFAAAVAARLR